MNRFQRSITTLAPIFAPTGQLFSALLRERFFLRGATAAPIRDMAPARGEAMRSAGLFETYHIETVAPEADGGRVIRRTSMRSSSLDAVKERALRTFQRAQTPQARDVVERVRVLNGAGYELFSVSTRD